MGQGEAGGWEGLLSNKGEILDLGWMGGTQRPQGRPQTSGRALQWSHPGASKECSTGSGFQTQQDPHIQEMSVQKESPGLSLGFLMRTNISDR